MDAAGGLFRDQLGVRAACGAVGHAESPAGVHDVTPRVRRSRAARLRDEAVGCLIYLGDGRGGRCDQVSDVCG